MNEESLTKELRQLEDRVIAISGMTPSSDLRRRVIRSIDAELQRPRRGWDGWTRMTLAASVLVVLNLSLISASKNQFASGPPLRIDPLKSELAALRSIAVQENEVHK